MPQKSSKPSSKPSAPSTASSAATRREWRRQREAQRRRNRYLAYGIIAVGVIVVVGLILWVNRPRPLDLSGVVTENPPNANGLAWGGPEGAAVVIREYSDFQCPFCARHALQTLPQLIERYAANPNVRYEFHPFSFLGAESVDAAMAALCAADQNKFWPYHDTLFANQRGENIGAFNRTSLRQIAQAVGLDMGQFDRCFDSGVKRRDVNDFLIEGRQRGVQSTPTFFINDQQILGAQPVEQFIAVIEQELAAVGGQ